MEYWKTRVLRLGLAVGLLGWSSASAQSVLVRVRAASAGPPVAGALVSLRDAKDQVVARQLANDRGGVRFDAAPGHYSLRVDAIGFEGKDVPRFELSAGTAQAFDVELTAQPLDLGELVVTSRRAAACRMSEERGTAVARLWDEARKALLATTLTGRDGPVLEIRTFERDLDRLGRIREERFDTRRGPSTRPFASVSADELDRSGYVHVEGTQTRYYGPDAELLLSESFLDNHCFSVTAPEGEAGSGLVGLAFRPTAARTLPDVRGVLWLDAQTAELRTLEFMYTNVRLPDGAQGVGGQIRFARITGGGFIVADWSIRMPRVVRIRGAVGGRDSLEGYREGGGEARQIDALTPGAGRAMSSLVGRVTDSTTGEPLAGVEVSIQAGALADTTDDEGRYRIDSPGQGAYVVTVADPRLALVGLEPLRRAARLDRGEVDTVDVGVPLLSTAIRRLCPADTARADRGLLIGQAVDSASGAPRADLPVRLRVVVYRFVNQSGIGERATELETRTNADGYFHACGLPVGKEVVAWLGGGNGPLRVVTTVPPSRMRILRARVR